MHAVYVLLGHSRLHRAVYKPQALSWIREHAPPSEQRVLALAVTFSTSVTHYTKLLTTLHSLPRGCLNENSACQQVWLQRATISSFVHEHSPPLAAAACCVLLNKEHLLLYALSAGSSLL
eukprot:635-Heterococcus_DN1.PRE.2